MKKYKIGVISDTHGLLREEVLEILKGCDLIIHAGDVVDPTILKELKKIAPVTAVRGNCDKGNFAYELNKTELVEVENILIYVLHDIDKLDIDLETSGINIVISGHSHRPLKVRHDNVLFLNPGSAGPKRFNLPISMAILNIDDNSIDAELINISSV
ncbi:phosphodiesterase [Clostridium carboxidivorans P7]|uniref:Phosphoesterase n=1 Tax=Clostridium carboxidivorans P7 TaxID=536227 RepID=C6PSV5_9CLOT|nr:metallophosphoesterase family protein [Clostridium carboxidivorans]AKN30278.1 phosphodiesterase [Clostridium carboxidivorans P7]EET87694.1 phosphodiesterase, MJ0936 family [Clostridium carboxidivorans P7]